MHVYNINVCKHIHRENVDVCMRVHTVDVCISHQVLRALRVPGPLVLGPEVLAPLVLSPEMADSDTAWRVTQVLFGEDVRNGMHSQRFSFKLVRMCGLSDRLTGYSSRTIWHM